MKSENSEAFDDEPWISDPATEQQLDDLLNLAKDEGEIDAGQLFRVRESVEQLLRPQIPSSLPQTGSGIGWRELAIAASVVVLLAVCVGLLSSGRGQFPEERADVSRDEKKNDNGGVDSPFDRPVGVAEKKWSPSLSRITSTLQGVAIGVVSESAMAVGRPALLTGGELKRLWLDPIVLPIVSEVAVISLRTSFTQIDSFIRLNRPRTVAKRSQIRKLRAWRQALPILMVQELGRRSSLGASRSGASPNHENLSPVRLISDKFLFRMICASCDASMLEDLVRWVDDPDVGRDVCMAWNRLANSDALAMLAVSIQGDQSRIMLMGELLRRGDERSVQLYLDVAARLERFDLIVASASSVRELPARWLVTGLSSNRRSVVRAAAAALSQDRRYAVSEILRQLACNPIQARGAMLAIAGRSDPFSIRLAERMRSDLACHALFAAAEVEWRTLSGFDRVVSQGGQLKP